ncbi:MAG: hypothetical protein QNL63_11180, partial [Paracoccaceae bacterium]
MKTAFASRTSQSLGRGALRSGISPVALPDGTNRLNLQKISPFGTSLEHLRALELKLQALIIQYQNNYIVNTFERLSLRVTPPSGTGLCSVQKRISFHDCGDESEVGVLL